MVGSCWLFTHLQLHEMLSAELPGSRSRRRRHVSRLCEQLFVRGKSIFHSREFRIGQRNILAQSQQVRFGFEKLRFRRIFWQVKRALSTSHAMRALIEKIVRAVTMAEIVKLPRLVSSTAVPHQLLIDKYFDGPEVPCEVAGRRAGVTAFPIYTLRHVFCTRLSEVAPDAVVQRAMRHSSPETKRHYQLGMAEQVRHAVNKANKRLNFPRLP